jgi:hypothetical protein
MTTLWTTAVGYIICNKNAMLVVPAPNKKEGKKGIWRVLPPTITRYSTSSRL